LQLPTKFQQFASSFEDEAALRYALIALLERMPGVSNVRHTHGIDERGKDIIFDSAGPFGQTFLIACVVKNDKITGSAGSSSGARTIYNQAEQALGLKFTDTKGVEQQVSQVFVITPAECSTAATESIKDKLQSNGHRVAFICGPELLNLFEKFYPEFLLFQSGLFGSYVATLEKEFESNQSISSVLFRSGFTSGAESPASVYIRPSFFQTLHKLKLSVVIPEIGRLQQTVHEEAVAEFQLQLRQLAKLVLALLSPDPEARLLEEELLRYANDLGTSWKYAYETHRMRRDLPPEEQRKPCRTLKFEVSRSVLLPRGEDLLHRCAELLSAVRTKIDTASTYVDLSFDTPRSALQSPLLKDALELETLSQQVPASVVKDDGAIKRIDVSSNLLDIIKADLLIVGPAGFGKSSFCRYQALHDFSHLREGTGEVWPAYVELHKLADGTLGSFEQSILANHDLIEFWKEIASSGNTKKRFRIYLDGLDEIPSIKRQQEVLTLAMTAKKSFANVQLVVTSREHVVGNHLRDLVRIRIRDFDDAQIEEFLGKWFGEENSELPEFKSNLAKVPGLHELMRVAPWLCGGSTRKAAQLKSASVPKAHGCTWL
jgi:hypothetical protein